MFDIVVQWVGILTALPISVLLVAAVLFPLFPYAPGGVRLELLKLARKDLAVVSAEYMSVKQSSQYKDVEHALHELDHEIAKMETEAVSQEQEEQLAQLATQLLGGSEGTPDVLKLMYRHRDVVYHASAESFRRRFRRHVWQRSATSAVKWRTLYILCEELRVAIYAARHEGVRTATVVLTQAAKDVTNASVIGLVLAVLLWFMLGHFQAPFLLYLANGVTLGAFVGLGITTQRYARQIFRQPYQKSPRAFVLTACLAYTLLIANLILMYVIRPSWWPHG